MKAVARDAQPKNPAGLPSVDRVLGFAEMQLLVERHGRMPVLDAVRALLKSVRAGASAPDWSGAALALQLGSLLEKKSAARLRRVINLTGTVLHTNLGRALLPDEAVRAVALAMTSA